ncbi:MAG: HAD-IC family P-type ATPase [Clostridiales bacterium]|nr:HAD-IC family P-type ATPase [Clostridiales bacterium]
MSLKNNKKANKSQDTVLSIVCKNVFTYFNLVFAIIAVLLIIARSYRSLTFLPIIIANTGIGIFQQLRSKKVLDQLSVLAQASYEVERNGETMTVPMDDLQVDDIIHLDGGQQIPADGTLCEGLLNVNESLLTGEADEIEKIEDAPLMSGSFVVSGHGKARLTAVGEDCYAAQLTNKAREIKEKKSEMVKNIELIIKIAGIAIIPLGIALYVEGVTINHLSVSEAIVAMVGAIIGMIPEGLYLLLTVALALGAMYLAQKQVLLHDMRSIETLARVDVLCVDKTGTITSNDMSVTEIFAPANGEEESPAEKKSVIEAVHVEQKAESGKKKHSKKKKHSAVMEEAPLEHAPDYMEVKPKPAGLDKECALVVRYITTVDDGNITMNALKEYFGTGEAFTDCEFTQFTSKLKYSEVILKDATYRLGAPDILLTEESFEKNRKGIEARAEHGLRVLVLAKKNGEGFEPVLFIVLKNGIRKNAPETFSYFKNQGVEVKVISGDNPLTVSKIAAQVGIRHAERYVDATTLETDEDIENAVIKYTIFGRVKPEQKKSIVLALKRQGLKVAMTGDGVNDILAMKEADCSIAMGSGSDAARQAAQVVLLDSDFSRMMDIVSRGRQIINNITRSATVFLFKNIFSAFLAICAIIASFKYPLVPAQISLVTLFNTGVPAFLLSLEPNTRKQRQEFFRKILTNAGPAAFTAFFTIAVLAIYGERNGMNPVSVGVISTYLMAIAAFMLLVHISRPLNTYRSIVVQLMFFGFILFICVPITRDLYMITDINTVELKIFIAFAVIEMIIIKVLIFLLEQIRRQKRLDRLKKLGRWK